MHIKYTPGVPREGYVIFGTFKVAVELHFGQPIHMFERGSGDDAFVEPGDIQQGALGNCYYLCALSILSTHERLLFDALPDVPASLRPAVQYDLHAPDDEQVFNQEGVYAMRFWRDGKWRIVVVDDYVPQQEGYVSPFIFAQPAKGSAEIWCIIAEKAYAKLNSSYSVTAGGNAQFALEDLCGGVPFSFPIGDHAGNDGDSDPYCRSKGEASKKKLWDDLLRWRAEGSMLGAAWHNSSGGDHVKKHGLIGNHAYGIISGFNCKINDGTTVRLVEMRNPHGHGGEWDGEWSDDDTRSWGTVSAEEQARLHHVDADDGTFFMRFRDFWSMWQELNVCRVLMPTPYIQSDWFWWNIFGEWSGASAQGFSSVATVDQFQIEIPERMEIVITMAVHSKRVTGETVRPQATAWKCPRDCPALSLNSPSPSSPLLSMIPHRSATQASCCRSSKPMGIRNQW
tara:strand:+ start:37 stop:1398 length:1362 start_codon:yes stop_codon:yes gene_type:complete